jgi:hypothetical protein
MSEERSYLVDVIRGEVTRNYMFAAESPERAAARAAEKANIGAVQVSVWSHPGEEKAPETFCGNWKAVPEDYVDRDAMAIAASEHRYRAYQCCATCRTELRAGEIPCGDLKPWTECRPCAARRVTAIRLIPNRIRSAIQRHVAKGESVGGFVTAVLHNDLSEAIGRADEECLAAISTIVQYVYNEVPGAAWGSKEKVAAWQKKGGLEGKGAATP